MTDQETNTAGNWKTEMRNKRFRSSFVVSLVVLALSLFSLTRFLNYAEAREGIVFNDPLLRLFEPVNVTWFIFGIIYLSLFGALFSLIPHPRHLLFALQLYAVMVIARIIAMYLLPLNPPEGMIVLKDPLVEIAGTGKILTKDLFFSGHTASILIFFLTAKNRFLKTLFLILVFFIAVLVLLQKVHYSIDIYAAVFVTLALYFLLKVVKEKFNI